METGEHLEGATSGHDDPATPPEDASIAGLEQALQKSDLIDHAQGVLMERHRIDSGEALVALVTMAQNQKKPLRVIAEQVLQGRQSWGNSASGRSSAPNAASARPPMNSDPELDRSMTAPAAFSCDVTSVDDRTVIVIRGEVDLVTAPIVLQHLRSTLALPPGGLAVDAEEVTFMDSSGIHMLLAMRKAAAAQQVPFTLLSVADQTRKVLEVCDLCELFGLEPSPKTDVVESDPESGLVIKSPTGDVIIVQSSGPEDECEVAVDAPAGYDVKPF